MAIEPYRLIRTNRHKLVVFESGRQSLYDCVADPGEERDLIAEPAAASVCERLRVKPRERMKQTSDHAVAWLAG